MLGLHHGVDPHDAYMHQNVKRASTNLVLNISFVFSSFKEATSVLFVMKPDWLALANKKFKFLPIYVQTRETAHFSPQSSSFNPVSGLADPLLITSFSCVLLSLQESIVLLYIQQVHSSALCLFVDQRSQILDDPYNTSIMDLVERR